ncbi:DUF397 domain-containing protein [Streptomyces sp. SID3212]|uniref:DUF397 domain-containing protein n=1 Tax=unclassified Streptomyces TaxID=2593676 RepID=UPI0013712F9E|nr:DUF397 domain-containing protein [Streptomyces sp. SID3212]MYV55591.1 DUF397 domain-containing protein [Streptomyces sp. SID3212]
MTDTTPAPIWTKSSYSGGNSDCVEVAHGFPTTMPVRDSKRPTGPALAVPARAWTAFIACVKTGNLT